MAIVNTPDYAGTEYEQIIAERAAAWAKQRAKELREEELAAAPPADETLIEGDE